MSDIKKLLPGILDVAKAVAPLVVGGSPMGAAAVKAGQAVLKLMEEAKPLVAGTADEAQLEKGRAELEAKVHAHAQSTADRLGSG